MTQRLTALTRFTLTTLVVTSFAGLPRLSQAEEEKPPAAKRVTYDDDVAPLLRKKCFGCHNPDRKKGGLVLSTYTLAMAGGSSGEVVKPGDAEASRLLLLVTHQEEPHMPPRGDMLPDPAISMLRRWIEMGAPENKGSKVRPIQKPKIDLVVNATPGVKPAGPPPMPRGVSLEPVLRTAHTTAVTALATNPWSPLIAVSGQRQILLYDVERSELAGILPFPEGVAHVLRFSRNGGLLLAGGGRGADSGRVVVWEVRTGNRIVELGDEFDQVLAADISADHSLIAIGGPAKLVRIYATGNGELLHEIKKHTGWVYTLEFSPDGILLASGDRDGGLHVWESFSGREYLTLPGHRAAVTDVSWRADSNVLASASEDSTVRLWEMENGSQVKRWNAHGGGTLSVEFARDGRIATCGRDRRATVWNGNGGRVRNFDQLADLALEVTFDHSGSRVIVGDWTGEVLVWNAADGKRSAALSTNPITLAMRLERARKELAERMAKRDRIASEVATLEKNLASVVAELDKTRSTADEAVEKRTAAAARVVASRAASDAVNAKLEDALGSLTAREQELEKAVEAPTPNARTIESATTALDTARAATRTLTGKLTSTLDAREVASKALDQARAAMRTATDVVGKKTADVKDAKDRLSAYTASHNEQVARCERASATVERWIAAIEVDRSLRTIDRLSSELAAATMTLRTRKTAHARAAAQLAALTKILDEAATATRETGDAATAAARSLLEKSRASSAQASKVIAAIGATSPGEGSAKAGAGPLGQQIASIRKTSEELGAAVRAATKIWEKATRTAEASAAAVESTVGELEKQLTLVRTAAAMVATAAREVELKQGALDTARQARTRWIETFETATRAGFPSAGGLAATKP